MMYHVKFGVQYNFFIMKTSIMQDWCICVLFLTMVFNNEKMLLNIFIDFGSPKDFLSFGFQRFLVIWLSNHLIDNHPSNSYYPNDRTSCVMDFL